MFAESTVRALTDAAKAAGIEPAAMLAIAEVETAGRLFEEDGRTPRFLYERHVAYREAKKRGCLAKFVRAGLAIPKWDRATQYRDQRTSKMRLALIGRARAIDPETACRSASWGIGQTMGFLSESLGYGSAVAMVDGMIAGGLPAQVDAMVRELKRTRLIAALNARDWRRVARTYNGPGYAANRYDEKLEAAHARWTRRLARNRAAPPGASLPKADVLALQKQLRSRGYAEVGAPDGIWGSRTTGAVAAFQEHEGLPVTGAVDEATRNALLAALPREPSPERKDATVDDLRAAGSRTVAAADNLSWIARAKIALGGLFGAGAAANGVGLLDGVKGASEGIGQAKETARGLADAFGLGLPDIAIWLAAHPVVTAAAVLTASGVAVHILARRVTAVRLDDHQTGVNAGPATE